MYLWIISSYIKNLIQNLYIVFEKYIKYKINEYIGNMYLNIDTNRRKYIYYMYELYMHF